jgi:hypothetical protein
LRLEDATGGSALDGGLSRRNNRRHRWTGPARIGLPRCRRPRDGGPPPACGDWGSRLASAAAPVSAPPREGAASADAPGREQAPPLPAEALALVVIPA